MAVDCPSCRTLTVTMPTECANVSIVRHQVSFVSMVFGVLVVIELEYHLDALVEHLTVTMSTEYANVSIVRHQISFVSMVFGALVVIELESLHKIMDLLCLNAMRKFIANV